MAVPKSYFWKNAPFLRLLIPLITGIFLQWKIQADPVGWWLLILLNTSLFLSLNFITFFHWYKLQFLNGICISLVILAFGALLCREQDIRNHPGWFGRSNEEEALYLVSLQEPLVEKPRSFKAVARVNYILGKYAIPVEGKLIIYFKKDSFAHKLGYGSQLFFKTKPVEIRNSGNPGSFDYKRYALFKGITHQVFLDGNDFNVLPGLDQRNFQRFIYKSREKILEILRNNILRKKELGLAEALLIGYKDDLDKELVQSYANTGVVHIIAISGLHIGLIYWLLKFLLKPVQKKKKTGRWVAALVILAALWLFSLLAGAQASVLRSALMFTCIVIGESLGRKTSIYNTLAFSAFLLLCHDPFLLWDTGFQLSYAAVLSIVIFFRPIYALFYIQNKFLDLLWKMNAVTIAAQILTIPLTIYYFHQFPNYFLLSNFLAVPLSSLVLLVEIFLCATGSIEPIASLVGNILFGLIRFMNNYVEKIETLPGSLWSGLQIDIFQCICLYFFIAGISVWLIYRTISALKLSLASFLIFSSIRFNSFLNSSAQQLVIVYNIPRLQAIDLVHGRSCYFIGDTGLANSMVLKQQLVPSRTSLRFCETKLPGDFHLENGHFQFGNYKIILLSSPINFQIRDEKPVIDLLIASKQAEFDLEVLSKNMFIRQLVVDATVPVWRIRLWKKTCSKLHIPIHDVRDNGAFVMKLR